MDFVGFTWESAERLTLENRPTFFDDLALGTKKNYIDIPFANIIRVYVEEPGKRDILSIVAMFQVRNNHKIPSYEPKVCQFTLCNDTEIHAEKIAEFINLAVFDEPSPPPKRFKIIINPKSGKGKAVGLFISSVKPILAAAGCLIVDKIVDGLRGEISHVLVTSQPKEAMAEVARINVCDYDAILCVGGDGTVHEVINGLANRADGSYALRKLAIGTIPAGSGNALSVSLFGNCHPTYAAWQAVKTKPVVADLMSITPIVDETQPPPPTIWAFMSISFGWIAHADIHTESLRFMGDSRFTAGILWQMLTKSKYASSLAIHYPLTDSSAEDEATSRKEVKSTIEDHYNRNYKQQDRELAVSEQMGNASLTELLGTKRPMTHWDQKSYKEMHSFYAGKLPWTSRDAMAFPAALSNDGYVDLCILEGKVGYNSMGDIFKGFETGKHFHDNQIKYMKVRSFKLLPGIDYTGPDKEFLYRGSDATTDGSTNGTAYPKRKDTDTKKFKKDFVLSVDGERLDPGHGVICEVHQGLVKFIADSKLEKYQPTTLLKPSEASPPQREYTESEMKLRRWVGTMQERLDTWYLEKKAKPPGATGNLVMGSSSKGKRKEPAEGFEMSRAEVVKMFEGGSTST